MFVVLRRVARYRFKGARKSADRIEKWRRIMSEHSRAGEVGVSVGLIISC